MHLNTDLSTYLKSAYSDMPDILRRYLEFAEKFRAEFKFAIVEGLALFPASLLGRLKGLDDRDYSKVYSLKPMIQEIACSEIQNRLLIRRSYSRRS